MNFVFSSSKFTLVFVSLSYLKSKKKDLMCFKTIELVSICIHEIL